MSVCFGPDVFWVLSSAIFWEETGFDLEARFLVTVIVVDGLFVVEEEGYTGLSRYDVELVDVQHESLVEEGWDSLVSGRNVGDHKAA